MNNNLIIQSIEQLNNQIKQQKNNISIMNKRRKLLSSQPVVRSGEGLAENLASFLPKHLVPKNVGHINKVAWPFEYSIDFDLSVVGAWPDFTNATQLVKSFQVSQEAAFLMMGISRHADDYDTGGDLGPWTIEFRDRQSSRFFNDAPIPIQMIGQRGYLSYLAVPFLILPNAFMEIQLKNFLANGITQSAPGNSTGKSQFTCWGYRFRIEDANKVLSSIFG